MKYLLIILLSFFGLSGYSQLMQTNGTAGGYQFVALKGDSLFIIPRGIDTPAIGPTKYGKSTVGALFYKTTDSTFWVRSSNKWNQISGTGGSGIQSVVGGYRINVDATDPVNPIVNSMDTSYNFIFEAPIQANVYGDTVYVYLDSTGNGDYSIAHHSFGYYLQVFLTAAEAANTYITYDSAAGRFMDTAYYRTGAFVDSFFYSKGGVEYFWYTNPAVDRVIYGGIVTWTGTDLDYYVTACYFRKNGIYYLTNDTTVTLPPLADADSSRTDVFIVQTLSDTEAQTTTITGTESANPVTPQVDGNTDLYLTSITLNPGQTTGLTDTLIVYDNLSGGEFEYRGSTGVTTNFSNTTNVYRVPYSVDVSAINNNDVIGFGTETQRNALNYLGLSFFIKLKTVMPNSNGMLVSLWNNGVQVSNEVGIPFNRTNLTYQGFSVPMASFGVTNALFDSVRFRYAGGGAGISGMYIDFVYFQGNLNPGGPTTDGNTKWVTQGSGIIIDSTTTPTVYNISADTSLLATQYYVDSSISAGGGGTGTVTSVATNTGTGITGGTITTTGTLAIDTTIISTRAWRDKLADSLGAIIATKGTGTVTSLTQGYGILNSTNPITTTGTQRIDTFAISTRAWRDKLADSLGALLALKVKYTDTSTMLAPYVAGGSITWPGTIFSTPTTGTVTTHNINFAPSLANQSAYTIFGNHTSGSATPTFAKINVLSINATGTPSGSTVLYGDGSWGAAGSGGIPADSIYFRQLAYPNRNILSKTAGNSSLGIYGGTSLNPRNIGISDSALLSITTGTDNLALGYRALQLNATTNFNIAIGNQVLTALVNETSASGNTGNIGIGYQALNAYQGVTTGTTFGNIAIGRGALKSLSSTGYSNIAIGTRAMGIGLGGLQNTVIGHASYENGTGQTNTIIGHSNALLMTAGNSNTFVGNGIAAQVTSGDIASNLFFGNSVGVGSASSTGDFNTAIGQGILGTVWVGASNNIVINAVNVADGLTSGNRNIEMYVAGSPGITTGGRNVMIGDQPKPISTTGNAQISINNIFNRDASGRVYINTTTGDISAAPTINASAQFTIAGSTTGGFLIPVLTTTQQNAISSPATGLQIYNSDLKRVTWYDGTAWMGVIRAETGTAAPATTPLKVGDTFTDTTNKKMYVATGTASSSDWTILN